jgi:hypothetical protein
MENTEIMMMKPGVELDALFCRLRGGRSRVCHGNAADAIGFDLSRVVPGVCHIRYVQTQPWQGDHPFGFFPSRSRRHALEMIEWLPDGYRVVIENDRVEVNGHSVPIEGNDLPLALTRAACIALAADPTLMRYDRGMSDATTPVGDGGSAQESKTAGQDIRLDVVRGYSVRTKETTLSDPGSSAIYQHCY